MFPVLALIFLLVPVIEIYILIQVGQVIGALWTVFFVVFTAVIGVQLLRSQGLSTLSRAQHKMNQGELPAHEMMEGLGLVVAGAFLLTPGFFTDIVGFLLLFPPTRSFIVTSVAQRLSASAHVHVQGFNRADTHNRRDDVIDGVNYNREED